MNYKEAFTKGALSALGIIIGAYFVSNAINNYTYYGRSIDVKGLSERDVIANTGALSLDISLAGNDVLELNKTAAIQKQAVVDGLIKAGFKAEEINTNLPVRVEDKMLDRYNDRFDPAKQARYILETSLRVETKDVERLYKSSTVINEFVSQGIIFKGATSPVFYFDELNKIKPEMLQEAGANAYKSAVELANNTKSKVGKIKRASQGPFSIRLRTDTSEYESSYGKASPYLRVRVVTNVTYFIAD